MERSPASGQTESGTVGWRSFTFLNTTTTSPPARHSLLRSTSTDVAPIVTLPFNALARVTSDGGSPATASPTVA